MNGCLIAGILLNSGLILWNRFAYPLADWLRFSLQILAVALLVIGLLQSGNFRS